MRQTEECKQFVRYERENQPELRKENRGLDLNIGNKF